MNLEHTIQSSVQTVSEVCPKCEMENTIKDWNLDKEGLEAYCPRCGHKMLLCSECPHGCDWNSETNSCRFDLPKEQIQTCCCCGADVIRMETTAGEIVCSAVKKTYWLDGEDKVDVYTPNGEHYYGSLNGEFIDAFGMGYILHTCSGNERKGGVK